MAKKRKINFKDLKELETATKENLFKLIQICPGQIAKLILSFELIKCDYCSEKFKPNDITQFPTINLCYICRGY